MFTLEDIFEAYYDCRKHKRGSASCIEFEVNFDRYCIQLWEELNNRTYEISASTAFIVNKPRKREIFAADFRDRVAHHLVDIKIRPLIELELSDRTYNNRIGKGSSACINQLKIDMREISEGYTKDCWIAKMDLKGFFMSLNKRKLCDLALLIVNTKYVGDDKDSLVWLIEKLVMDSPELNCVLKSPLHFWDGLDKNKSLFTVHEDLGMPIGNLISQLLANYFLSLFDHYVESLFPHYGRYVDDFYILSTDKDKLLNAIPAMRDMLSKIGITLHPDKFYFQHYGKGVEFLGAVIKPHRSYIAGRTVNNGFQKLRKLDGSATEKKQAVINSYLGLMQMHSSFNIRKRFCIKSLKLSGFYAPGNFKKVILVEDLKKRTIITRKIQHEQKICADKRKQAIPASY